MADCFSLCYNLGNRDCNTRLLPKSQIPLCQEAAALMLRTGCVWHFQGPAWWGFPSHSNCETPEVTSEAGGGGGRAAASMAGQGQRGWWPAQAGLRDTGTILLTKRTLPPKAPSSLLVPVRARCESRGKSALPPWGTLAEGDGR